VSETVDETDLKSVAFIKRVSSSLTLEKSL
jgi:hypothetical protein